MKVNQNKRVVQLISVCFGIYFGLSVLSYFVDFKSETFDKLNLLSEVVINKSKVDSSALAKKEEPAKNTVNKKPKTDFSLYEIGNLITNFRTDNSSALPILAEKLYLLQNGKKTKIRIAYFGDSMIEGDLLTQTLRKLLQDNFGGNGVGYVPMHSNVAGFRTTATVRGSNWKDTNFKNKSDLLYLSGHSYSGKGKGEYTDNTLTNEPIEIALLYGKGEGSITVNGQQVAVSGHDAVNRKVLLSGDYQRVEVANNEIGEVYGVSFESNSGVIVDNFSFRGITGVELNKISDAILKSINKNNHYDLVVFQYGVNLMFRKNDTNYDYYGRNFDPVIKKFKKNFPTSEFLLVSAADRAFRYDGTYKSAKGLPNLLKIQAELAYNNDLPFFNLFQTMGGENSIVEWTKQNPPLANKDYIHPNHKGAEILAERIYHAMMDDYKRYKLSK